MEILVIHSDCDVTSSFKSSSEGLNFLYDAFIRTQLDNMHGSFPSDCPHRERLGYTGDGQLGARPAMMFLDTKEFYRKWIQDILDCQDLKSGHVQHTAPFMGGGGGPGGWGCAIVFVPFEYYKQFGDIQVLKDAYEPILKWFGYLKTRMDNNLITREEEKGWCLGDWCVLEKLEMPAPFVNTCLFVKALRQFFKMAEILGKNDDLSSLKKLEQDLCEAIKANFLSDDGHFCGGKNGADLFAYEIGLLDDSVMDEVAKDYEEKGNSEFICEVSLPIARAEALAVTPMEKAHTKAAASVMRRIMETDTTFNKEHTATGHWNFFSRKDMEQKDHSRNGMHYCKKYYAIMSG